MIYIEYQGSEKIAGVTEVIYTVRGTSFYRLQFKAEGRGPGLTDYR